MKEQLLAVQRMQDYIEGHLEQEITLAQMAKAALFSPWYAHRLFCAYTGLKPAEYIRKLRLSRSAQRLKNEGCRITDVALELGFGSQDGYQRAFFKEFGCNPGEYARRPVPITLFIPYGVKFREMRKEVCSMENLQSVFIQVIQRPERKVVIKRGVQAEDYFAYCDEVGCDVWGLLSSMDSLCGEPICLWLPKTYQKPNTSMYVQGVEVEPGYNGVVPDGFDLITLPASEYLMFHGEPFQEEDYSKAILALQHAIDRYDPAVIGYEWNDDSPRIQLEPRGERGYIELKAIKRRAAK